MRILHLITWLHRGGLESWLLRMLDVIPRSLCQMDICCKGDEKGPWARFAEQLGAEVILNPLRPSHVGYMSQLKRIINRGKYDIVHNHLHTYCGIGVWVGHRAGVPVITTFHATDLAQEFSAPNHSRLNSIPGLGLLRRVYSRLSVGYALRYSDMVTAVSRGVLDRLIALAPEVRKKSRVIYHGVHFPRELTTAEKSQLKRAFGLDSETPLVLHVGRFDEGKNHIGVISIFENILKSVPRAELLLVGDGPLRSWIEWRVAERKLTKSIHLLGARDDVPSIMQMCDLLLFPSLSEGFGLVPLEANAAGLPVVASEIPGLMEAVEHGAGTVLHEPSDIRRMADSAVRILTDSEFSRKLAETGLARARARFSLESNANRLVEAYQDCLTHAKGTRPISTSAERTESDRRLLLNCPAVRRDQT
jgi:glycosyltransferase EpsF